MAEIDWVKVRYHLGAPVRQWKSSLTLRVVSSAMLGSFLVMMVAGLFMLYRVTGGVITSAQESAVAEANEAMGVIEQQMRATGFDSVNADAVYSVVTSSIQRGNASGRYQVQFVTSLGSFAAANLDTSCITEALRESVKKDPALVHWVPTQVFNKESSGEPGLVVAMSAGTGRDRYEVYFVYSFTQEARMLALVRTAFSATSAVVLVGVGIVSYGVARQALGPVRVARRAAEKLARGELTHLMPVRGTDDLAQLAVSMNHMATQLHHRIRQWEQLSRLQQRFVSDVSHELRTPLTTVRMAVDVIYDQRESLPQVPLQSIELLNKELNRFEALLGDLLEISRFDAGAAQLEGEVHDVGDLVRQEIESLGELASTTGSKINYTCQQECTAIIDARRITRLVRNLISNALEHGEGLPIEVTVAKDDEVVALAVRDHGVGFDIDEATQLFERFWRADPARTRHIGGTGLGLAISQEDVRLHRGWIHAWGRPGQGAQFRVVLPRGEDIVVTVHL